MGAIRLYIYDLNGAITDTERFKLAGWKELASQLRFDLSEKNYQKIRTLPPKEALERILRWSALRISEAEKHHLISELKKRYQQSIEEMDRSHVRPGFRAFNQMIRQNGMRTAVISTARHAIRIVDRLDLVLDFDAIVDARMTEHADVYEGVLMEVLEKLQLPPQEACLISTSTHGLNKAQQMGMTAIHYGDSSATSELKVKSWDMMAEAMDSAGEVHEQ